MKKLTQERLLQLNLGLAQANNLMESLAINYQLLISTHFPDFNFPLMPTNLGITKKMNLIAQALYDQYQFGIFDQLLTSKSDSLRGMACFLVAKHYDNLNAQLTYIKPLANDDHFGVREWSWMALRPNINNNINLALELLQHWTTHTSPYIRRFACEATRPRGVWCSHNHELRKTPWLALNLLKGLNNDEHNYVQLSVGNWLNDAGKDHPIWVKKICNEWLENSPTIHTQKICKRALRNLT